MATSRQKQKCLSESWGFSTLVSKNSLLYILHIKISNLSKIAILLAILIDFKGLRLTSFHGLLKHPYWAEIALPDTELFGLSYDMPSAVVRVAVNENQGCFFFWTLVCCFFIWTFHYTWKKLYQSLAGHLETFLGVFLSNIFWRALFFVGYDIEIFSLLSKNRDLVNFVTDFFLVTYLYQFETFLHTNFCFGER